MSKPKCQKKMMIGVLAIQGSVAEHISSLRKLNIKTREVRRIEDLKDLDGLIMPGGESTTMSKLLKEYELDNEIIDLVKKGFPVYGTCAGLILLSQNVDYALHLMDVDVERNAYGRQLDSFETEISFLTKKIPAVFIRAPLITRVGKDVETIACHEKYPVLVRQKNMLASTFHPELTQDLSVYDYFIKKLVG